MQDNALPCDSIENVLQFAVKRVFLYYIMSQK